MSADSLVSPSCRNLLNQIGLASLASAWPIRQWLASAPVLAASSPTTQPSSPAKTRANTPVGRSEKAGELTA